MIRFGPTTLPGMADAAAARRRLRREERARPSRIIIFYYCFGLFKTAVVAQQIYYRFHKGLTRDQRFGMFIHAVRIMAQQAARALERDSL